MAKHTPAMMSAKAHVSTTHASISSTHPAKHIGGPNNGRTTTLAPRSGKNVSQARVKTSGPSKSVAKPRRVADEYVKPRQ